MERVIRDIPIYYEVHGSGAPLVTIHGWSVDHRLMKGCLEPVFQAVETPWQRIYFDLPGMGRTPGPAWISGSDDMLAVVLEFIDSLLPGQRFALAGESYGGYLARGVMKERAARVDGLLLIAPVAFQETLQENAVLPLRVLEKDEAFFNSLSEEDQISFAMLNVVQNQRVWQRYAAEIIPAVKMADYPFLEKCLSRHVPFKDNVDQVERPYPQPSLFVMGRQDSAVGYRDHWKLIENFPRATFAILDKAGHSLQIEQDAVFTALVKEWLERVHAEG